MREEGRKNRDRPERNADKIKFFEEVCLITTRICHLQFLHLNKGNNCTVDVIYMMIQIAFLTCCIALRERGGSVLHL